MLDGQRRADSSVHWLVLTHAVPATADAKPLGNHVLAEDCWCEPDLLVENHIKMGDVWQHHYKPEPDASA